MYSIIAALLMNLLRHKAFASKWARKMPAEQSQHKRASFRSLKRRLANLTGLAFPLWTLSFALYVNARGIGTGAVLSQVILSKEFIITFASHRFSKSESNRVPTERKCMTVLYAILHFRQYLATR